jgi:hypothetical protein
MQRKFVARKNGLLKLEYRLRRLRLTNTKLQASKVDNPSQLNNAWGQSKPVKVTRKARIVVFYLQF